MKISKISQIQFLKIIFFVFIFSSTFGQKKPVSTVKYQLKGKITNNVSKESLVGVGILVLETGFGTTTDTAGNYSMSLRQGTYSIIYSYNGFFKQEQKVKIVDQNISLNLSLDEKSETLEEVQISGNSAQQNVNRMETGVSKLSIKAIKKMPTLMGEADIIKSIMMLPGVSTVGEGATGFNVRGGSTDQNLILMDDAPIFNSSHLMGLFSIFNPDAVRGLTFYRGGVPAQYGGRTASVLNIDLKDANAQKLSVSGGFGLISSRLMVEAPIIKDKLSFFVASRISYVDYLFKYAKNVTLRDTKANFYDLTGKMEFRPTKNDKIWITAFKGDDAFKLAGDSLSNLEVNASSSFFDWKSKNGTLGWNHNFKKFSTRILAVQSDYNSNISNPDSLLAYKIASGLKYQSVKGDFSFKIGKKLSYDIGAQAVNYFINPGSLTPNSSVSGIKPVLVPNEKGTELAAYINNENAITDNFSILLGLRYSTFANKGDAKVYHYQEGFPRETTYIKDSTIYKNNESIKRYGGFEPRISLKYSFNKSSSIKASFNRMRQYIQLITNTTAALPTDRWKVSDEFIKPQVADQIALGFFQNLRSNEYEASIEVFYKKMQNVSDYKDGVRLILNKFPETAILQGKGEAYGTEFYLKKNLGQLTGWLSYTFSQTRFTIDSKFLEEKINNGLPYAPNYNKPHIFNGVFNYQFNKRTSFSTNITYSSGRPITYPADKYFVGGVYIPNFVNRNQNKIPDYFRSDISFNIDSKPTTKRFSSSLSFSVYNITNRRNAYSVYFKTNARFSNYYNRVDIYKFSVLGAALPSISYNFKL
jgi:ferric enterobactin receptor